MADRLHTYISITKNEWTKAIAGVDEVCRRAASAAFEASADPSMMDVEVSILLGDNEKLRTLNREYRKTDEVTNVLSFSNSINGKVLSLVHKPFLLGDIAVAGLLFRICFRLLLWRGFVMYSFAFLALALIAVLVLQC